MIEQQFIAGWRSQAPWPESHQVEQDLVLSKAIVQIFSDPLLKTTFAFRGGTALQKLVFDKPNRYSEDIDLVQVESGPVGKALDALRSLLDPWLGKPRIDRKEARVTLSYKFKSEVEPVLPMRLKVEINTDENFMLLPSKRKTFQMQSAWFQGQADVLIYETEELLGTKLRALYQRKKGRDLYDMCMALQHIEGIDCTKIVECFHGYMKHQNLSVSRAQFESNLHGKLNDLTFTEDILPLLSKSAPKFDPVAEAEIIKSKLITLLPGEPWKGQKS
ncbi:MAG: nucleotidyl transferase AbiEii/AbiGii toxin family protein [Bdellovibrionaceae bacterium]|nr:nucleotidyl transferase AbiEii/AbiGii toxin family protein [Pseudobdellovibrionaceae bacterium]